MYFDGMSLSLQIFANRYYFDIYLDGMYLLLLYVIPLSTLGFFNCRLVQAIRYRLHLCHLCNNLNKEKGARVLLLSGSLSSLDYRGLDLIRLLI